MAETTEVHPAVPQDWDINTSALVTSNEPEKIYREYDYLRTHCPVAHVDKHDGYWVLTRYNDVKEVSSNNAKYISYICAVVPADPRGIRRPPLKFDGENHKPYRTAIDRTLKPARLKRLEPIVRAHCERELQVLLDRGHGDIYEEFGARWTSWIEKEWLNLDEEDSALLVESFSPFVYAWRMGEWETVKKWSEAWYGIARRVVDARKKSPLDPEVDPASSLLLERDKDGQPLDEEHIIGCIRQIVIIAMVAPTIVITAITKHLSEDKELQNKLRNDHSLLPAAIEEFIRLHVPYRGFSRTAVNEEEISGTRVPPEEPITVVYSAANRDPEQFPEPDKFILNRENINSHLGFGRGIHRCAGTTLARMIIRVYLETILDRCADWDVSGDIVYAKLPEIGPTSCPITFRTA
ncbi:cytochrome P450 [Aspergillus heterothallicus]